MSSLSHQHPSGGVLPWDARENPRPAIGLRLRVLSRRARLDRMLADGVDPQESHELALRATQLVSGRTRRALADSLDEVVRIADGDRRRRSASPALAIRDVRASTAALLGLARGLREDREVDVRGVALAQQLLTNGSGPLYVYGQDDELWHAARDATTALDGNAPSWPLTSPRAQTR
jgi:hypothetical protein